MVARRSLLTRVQEMADARENRQGLQSISDAASTTAVTKMKKQRLSAQHDPSQMKLILVPQTTQKWQSLEKPTCTSPVTPLPAKVTEAPEGINLKDVEKFHYEHTVNMLLLDQFLNDIMKIVGKLKPDKIFYST